MAGLVPAIHVFLTEPQQERRDARDKRGRDAESGIRAESVLRRNRNPV